MTGWIAIATACVGWIYWRGAPDAFQKDEAGRIPIAICLLLAPTIAGAWINSRIWTRKLPSAVRVAPGVYLGRTPTACEVRRERYRGVVDLTAEMPRWTTSDASLDYIRIPQIDLVAPSLSRFDEAVHALDGLHRERGEVLVHCALGLGRSVLCVAGCIAMRQGVSDARDALLTVRRVQPRAVWSEDGVVLLQNWIDHVMPREAAP